MTQARVSALAAWRERTRGSKAEGRYGRNAQRDGQLLRRNARGNADAGQTGLYSLAKRMHEGHCRPAAPQANSVAIANEVSCEPSNIRKLLRRR